MSSTSTFDSKRAVISCCIHVQLWNNTKHYIDTTIKPRPQKNKKSNHLLYPQAIAVIHGVTSWVVVIRDTQQLLISLSLLEILICYFSSPEVPQYQLPFPLDSFSAHISLQGFLHDLPRTWQSSILEREKMERMRRESLHMCMMPFTWRLTEYLLYHLQMPGFLSKRSTPHVYSYHSLDPFQTK